MLIADRQKTMYRRRLRKREIDFGFDSFLDLVANVIGVIIRFILVAWVGARSYNSLMTPDVTSPTREGPPGLVREDAHPLTREIAALRQEIDQSKARMLDRLEQMKMDRAHTLAAEQQFTHVAFQQRAVEQRRRETLANASTHKQILADQALTIDELRKRSRALHEQIAELGQMPVGKKLCYRVPVSRPVMRDEAMFECQRGKVTFIELQAFVRILRRHIDDEAGDVLRSNWSMNGVTPQIGDYRMRYVVSRRRGTLDGLSAEPPAEGGGFSYGLSRWVLEPMTLERGESAAEALQAGSRFRDLVDRLLPGDAVVTLWVYPDSFDTFRQLRDFLHERGIEVAGRPLPFGVPIAASQEGTASRAQ